MPRPVRLGSLNTLIPFMFIDTLHPGTATDLTEVGRLRYQVYISEMGKSYKEADHRSKSLLDDLDSVSTHFLVRSSSGTLVATLRYTELQTMTLTRLELEGLGALATDSAVVNRSSLSSRLILDKAHRGCLRVLPDLVEAIYCHGVRAGSLLNFLHCDARLVPLFHRMGFYHIAPEFYYIPTSRLHSRLCLCTDAAAPLDAVHSRLAALCRQLYDTSLSPASDDLLTRARALLAQDTVACNGACP